MLFFWEPQIWERMEKNGRCIKDQDKRGVDYVYKLRYGEAQDKKRTLEAEKESETNKIWPWRWEGMRLKVQWGGWPRRRAV